MIKTLTDCNLKIIFLLINSLLPYSLFAQGNDQSHGFTMPEITRASPSVNNLIALDEINMSYYTGQPNISIPIFQHSIKDFNYSLSLNYNSTGIRTNELSSWVGTGWSLDAVGVISRAVVGLPDEMNSPNNQGTGVYYLDFENDPNINSFYDLGTNQINGPITENYHNEEYYYNALWSEQKLDTHRDIYQFHFFGNSGQFIIEKDDAGKLVPKIIGNDSDVRFKHIEFIDNDGIINYPKEEIEWFEIIDSKGYTYYFEAFEETDKLTLSKIDNVDGTNRSTIGSNVISFRSSWRITKIMDDKGELIVNFDYHDPSLEVDFEEDDFTELISRSNLRTIERYPINCNIIIPSNTTAKSGSGNPLVQGIDDEIRWLNFLAEVRQSRERFWNIPSIGVTDNERSEQLSDVIQSGGGGGPNVDVVSPDPDPPCPNQPNCNIDAFEPGFVGNTSKLTIRKSKKLKSIIFSDGVRITIDDLHSDLTNNHPEYYGWVLNSLSIFNNFGLLKKVDFDYDSVLRANSPDLQGDYVGKLYLNGVKFYNNSLNDYEQYDFDYNPPILERSLGFDGSRLTLHPQNDFGYYYSGNKENYAADAIKGSLKSITYPTGGIRKFNWESNTYSFKGNRLLSFEEIKSTPGNYIIHDSSVFHESIYGGTLSGYHNDQNPTSSTYGSIPDWVVSIPENQYVEFRFRNVTGDQFLESLNYRLFIIPITANGSIDNTRSETHLKLSQNSLNFTRIANLEQGDYRIFLGSQTLEQPTTNIFPSNPISMDVDIKYTELKNGALNWFKYGGGIRINSIENWDSGLLQTINKYNYSLEPNTISYSELSDDGYPLPTDYPGNPNYPLSTPEFPIHSFSSGSLDGDSNLIRTYVYSKAINIVPDVDENKEYYLTIETQDALNAQLTQGNFIGYKNVADYKDENQLQINTSINSVKDKKVSKFLYDSAIDYPLYPYFYVYPFPPIEDKDFLRGNIKKQTVYDSSNKKLTETLFTYNYEQIDIENEVAQRLDFVINENLISGDQNMIRSGSFQDYNELGFGGSNYLPRDNGFCTTGSNSLQYLLNVGQSIASNNIFNITENLAQYTPITKYKVHMLSTEKRSFFYDGTESLNPNTNEVIPHPNNVVTTTQEFEYNSSNYLPSQTVTTDSKGDVLKSKTYYSVSSPPLGFNYQDGTVKAEMASANIITTPLAKETYLNDELTSKVEYVHVKRTPSTNDFVLDKVYSSKGDEDLELRLTYHHYDDYGNILDVSKKDGTYVSYIWGHNKTLPIAKIEGLTYQQVADRLTGGNLIALDNFDEDDLATIDSLRNSFTVEDPFMVTTYVYEVGIGIKEVTDPRGRKMTYFYDDFNRLKYVEDHDGNRLSENEYKYATQN